MAVVHKMINEQLVKVLDMFSGDFEPTSSKHSKHFSLVDSIEHGVAQMQRDFAPMVKAVDLWRGSQITDVTAKLLIYEAFVESATDFPKHLAKDVHRHYFEPQYEEFQPRTMWSLSNAFTSAFKLLDPIPKNKSKKGGSSRMEWPRFRMKVCGRGLDALRLLQ